MSILELLEKVEWAYCNGGCISAGPCLICKNDQWDKHDPCCELKAAIDALKSGKLVVVDVTDKKQINELVRNAEKEQWK